MGRASFNLVVIALTLTPKEEKRLAGAEPVALMLSSERNSESAFP